MSPGTASVFQCFQVGSDGLRLSVEDSRLQRALRACPRRRTHTNARMQWSFQGVAAVGSLSLRPGGAARLTKRDWQCQELRAQRLDLHKNFELLHKGLFGGDPSQSSVSRSSEKERERGMFANEFETLKSLYLSFQWDPQTDFKKVLEPEGYNFN